MLEDSSEQQAGLEFRKWHADADKRTTAKGEVRQWRHLLPPGWVPTLRTEHIWITPDIWEVVKNPLTQNSNSASREVITIQIKGVNSPAYECPRGRIDAPRFIDYPIEVGQICQIVHTERTALKDGM